MNTIYYSNSKLPLTLTLHKPQPFPKSRTSMHPHFKVSTLFSMLSGKCQQMVCGRNQVIRKVGAEFLARRSLAPHQSPH